MTWIVALPAGASVLALAVLALLGRRVDRELLLLRASLRRVVATGVAGEELRRAGAATRDQARDTSITARRRLHRPRLVGIRHPR